MTTLQQKRKASNRERQEGSVKESMLDPSESPFFVIKNLDNNKLEVYHDENEVDKELLGQMAELP